MITFLNGKIYRKTANGIMLDVGGVGYFVNASANTVMRCGTEGENTFIYTYMKVSEDGIALYGFLTEEELKMFNLLLSVNGIGPKSAVSLLSFLSPDDVVMAVLSEDTASLSKAQGLGKKTAQRIILDLKDKFKAEDLLPKGISPQQTFETSGAHINEAIDALLALGYSQTESTKAVLAVSSEGLSSSQIIKLALKSISSKV